jgi:formate hydrogenlyase subunit 4
VQHALLVLARLASVNLKIDLSSLSFGDPSIQCLVFALPQGSPGTVLVSSQFFLFLFILSLFLFFCGEGATSVASNKTSRSASRPPATIIFNQHPLGLSSASSNNLKSTASLSASISLSSLINSSASRPLSRATLVANSNNIQSPAARPRSIDLGRHQQEY